MPQKKPLSGGFFRITRKILIPGRRRKSPDGGERSWNFMKKRRLAALLAAAVLSISLLSGCGEGLVDLNASSQTTSEAASSALTETEVEDSLLGLEEFMIAQGYVSGTPSEMNGALIGAKELGHRYVSGSVTAEFYEYDLSSLNETAQTIRASVEENGTFEIVGRTVENVYLSDSGKYLMIYTNTATDEANVTLSQNAIAAFKAFKADAE